MFKKILILLTTMILTNLFAFSAWADNLILTNTSSHEVTFIVTMPSGSLNEKFTVKPSGTFTPFDFLEDRIKLLIYVVPSPTDPATSATCAAAVNEASTATLRTSSFHLPKVTPVGTYPLCSYTSNLPDRCDCFTSDLDPVCQDACDNVTYAKLNLGSVPFFR